MGTEVLKSKAKKLREQGASYEAIGRRLGVGRGAVYRLVNEARAFVYDEATKAYRASGRGKCVNALAGTREQARLTGIAPCSDSVELLMSRLKGRCECCGRKSKDLCLDHDHKSGRFRGWICRTCNSGIGQLGDNLKGVLKAVHYLRRKV